MEGFAYNGDASSFGNGFSHHSSSGDDSLDADDSSQDHSNGTDANVVFMREWVQFKSFWDHALSIYQPVEIAVIGLGLFGNVLGLLTLLRSQKMNSSPSFIYHRVLVGAHLIFCVTYFLHLIVKRILSLSCNTTFYKSWFGAYFAGTLTPAINHICGYEIMYMTLVIALDRFLALLVFEQYRRWNNMKVAYTVTVATCVLSVFFHCWAYFLHGVVIEFRLDEQFDESKSIVSRPCWNDPVVYHWIKRENPSRFFLNSLKAKDYYNGAIRVGYPICLCVLTLAVLISFAKRHKQRHRKTCENDVSSICAISDNHQANRSLRRSLTWQRKLFSSRRRSSTPTLRNDHSVNAFGSFTSGLLSSPGTPTTAHRAADQLISASLRHRQRCERALFYLMIAVILLAFLQVASSESRRILHLIFPPDELFKSKVLPPQVPMKERITNFRFLLYGHQATRIIANFCTAIDRSFICFLYIAMNNLFRRELWSMLNGILCPLFARCCPQFFFNPLSAQSAGHRFRNGIATQRLISSASAPPPSPANSSRSATPTPTSAHGTIPSATGRGYSNCRYLGEDLALLA